MAAPLVPALGAAFGILMALTVTSEAGYLKTAQETVSAEAAAASRLAWAATTPGIQAAEIQLPLAGLPQGHQLEGMGRRCPKRPR